MSEQWYYARGSATYGPVTWDLLQQLAAEGEVHAECLVWREGMPQWLPAAALGLGVASTAPLSPSAPSPAVSTSSSPAPPVAPASTTFAAPPPAPPVAPTSFAPPSSRDERLAATSMKPRATRPARRISPTLIAAGVAAVALAMALGWMVSEATRSNRTAANSTNRRTAGDRRKSADESSRPRPNADDDRSAPARESLEPRAESLPQRSERATPSESNAASANSSPTRKPVRPTDHSPEPAPTPTVDLPTDSPTPPLMPTTTATPPEPPPGPLPPTIPAAPPDTDESVPAPPGSPSVTTPNSTPTAKPNPKKSGPNALFQLIDIARAPKFEVLGTVMAQDLRYQILSQLYVDDSDPEGIRVVEQVVLDTRLVKADDLSRDQFVNSLREWIGWRCKYKVRPTGDVVEFQAVNKGRGEVLKVGAPGAEGFMITSVLDADGWREIAELTFFRPRETQSSRETWSRQTMHDFGPLGSWYGTTTFKPGADRRGIREFTYSHTLDHERPAKPAPAAPFRVTAAKLVPERAAGIIRYDDKLDRVESVREEFKVRGRVDTELAGQAIPVGLEEWQIIELGLHARNPWKK